MRIDVALVAFVVGAPNAIEQRVSGPGAAGLGREQFENLKFERREIDAIAVADHFVTPFVDHQIANLDPFAVGFGHDTAAAPQQRFDAIFELARTERLRQIVVRAGFEPGDFVGERVMRR